ncbi:hypothetical protein MNBD_GAMMA22-1585 [hydrothermal vent metagenome]|uniref:PilZ domain-containing protein n=1 Tax=hydrothermal vent metagenome TaxID=652676 RepID=A0A3B1AF65_9ZZZZ
MDFMDFRWDTRKSMNIGVTLACGHREVVTGITQNISKGGMYVTTDAEDVELYAHCMVKVEFEENHDEPKLDSLSDKVTAMVAYKDERGIGLMFYNNEIYDN